jgi:hypothetical protein
VENIKLPLKQGEFLTWEAYDADDKICFIAFDGDEASPEKASALVGIVNRRDALLEALEKAKEHIEENSRYDHDTGEFLDIEVREALEIIDAAIKQAKGEL